MCSANSWMRPVVLRSQRVVTGGSVRPASVHIREGVIEEVRSFGEVPPNTPVLEGVLMPGLVDTHVHINEPGRTEWEGFRTATKAAAAGGVTTLIEMPLNSIPATTSVAAYREKLMAATNKCRVDMGFWGGVVPGNARELEALYDEGVFGFKCFLSPSGVPEFLNVSESDLRQAMPVLARMGAPLLVHAEDPAHLAPAGTCYADYLRSRPREAENSAIQFLIRLVRETGTHVHIVHLSSSDALPRIADARAEGLPLTVETCPHYLYFSAEEIADGATEYKCAPPIRERENAALLWQALRDGVIDFVVSDHSPSLPEMKEGDFASAWGGIASLQFGLPVVWTVARSHGAGVEQIAEWMCRRPAKLAGFGHRKGAIEAGRDADLVLWNPEMRLRIEAGRVEHRHKLTPYAGREVYGEVIATWLGGRQIYDRGQFPGAASGYIWKRGHI